MTVRPRLILASRSPRRLSLLEQIRVTPDAVEPADLDEAPFAHEMPRHHAARLARDKAQAVAALHSYDEPRPFILAADTVVACGRRILPKAENEDQARQCLDLLSGRGHIVYTGLTLVDAKGAAHDRLVATRVVFKSLSDLEKTAYVASREWDGKAGGYAVQGLAAAFIKSVNGSYSNVVGLPLYETAQLLNGCGYPVIER